MTWMRERYGNDFEDEEDMGSDIEDDDKGMAL